jgi:hypothetical protein
MVEAISPVKQAHANTGISEGVKPSARRFQLIKTQQKKMGGKTWKKRN